MAKFRREMLQKAEKIAVQSRQIFYTFALRAEVHITIEAEMVPTSARIHSRIYTKFATFPGLYFPNFTNFEMLFLASADTFKFFENWDNLEQIL
jgi:hypothetical protein